MSKYSARKVLADGHTFDSRAEHRRYQALKLLAVAGEIDQLEVHPRFELVPAFTDGQGKRHRAMTYEADFRYRDLSTFHVVVEDVKGVRTRAFSLKHKLLMYRNRGLDFRIVEARHV